MLPAWLHDAVFYEIYPQSFADSNGDGIGDIPGITGKLDYIKKLGCNAIWLNPFYDSPFMDAGYDVRDYKKTAPRYGTNEDVKHLLGEAHKRGMHVIFDLVPGHTSDEHEWFIQSQKHERNEYSDRYVWTNSVWERPEGFPCVSGKSQRSGCYMLNFFDSQPALNYGFAEVTADWQTRYTEPAARATFDAMLDVMRFWLDMGCDGFRVDMANYLVKNDEGKRANSELWQIARAMLDQDYPEAVLVAEWSCPPEAILQAGFDCDFYLDHQRGNSGDGNGYHRLTRSYNEPLGRQRSYFSSEAGGDIHAFLDEYLPWYSKTRGHGYIGMITCNHDTPRLTRRLDEDEVKLVYAFIFTMPGVPFLYYGDEIGMKYFPDLPSLEGGYQRTGTRTPMQWDAGRNLGFSSAEPERLYLPVDPDSSAPTVAAQEGKDGSLLAFTREVIALRRDHQDLGADADFEALYAENNGYPFVYRRGGLICAVNPSLNTTTAPVNVGRVIFSHNGANADEAGIILPPQSFGVFDRV